MRGGNRVTARLELDVGSGEVAEMMIKSLSPDNVEPPAGLDIRLERSGGKLVVIVSGPLERLMSVKNTVEDILLSLTPVYDGATSGIKRAGKNPE